MNQRKDLLNRLAALAGAEYLSDLHDVRRTQDILRALQQIAPNEYPAALWEEAVSYILKETQPHFKDSGSAYHFLRDRLINQRP